MVSALQSVSGTMNRACWGWRARALRRFILGATPPTRHSWCHSPHTSTPRLPYVMFQTRPSPRIMLLRSCPSLQRCCWKMMLLSLHPNIIVHVESVVSLFSSSSTSSQKVRKCGGHKFLSQAIIVCAGAGEREHCGVSFLVPLPPHVYHMSTSRDVSDQAFHVHNCPHAQIPPAYIERLAGKAWERGYVLYICVINLLCCLYFACVYVVFCFTFSGCINKCVFVQPFSAMDIMYIHYCMFDAILDCSTI